MRTHRALSRQCLHAEQQAIGITVLPGTMSSSKGSQEGDQGSILQYVPT